MRIEVHGRAAHSSTPWLGDNAVLKAIDVFRAIESLPFSRESSELFDRPSINLGRIQGGDALNKVPDVCTMAVDVRYLPGQDPDEILEQVRAIPAIEVTRTFIYPPVSGLARQPVRARAARRGHALDPDGEAMSVGRDGASDAAVVHRRPGSRRSSSARPAPATTGRRNGCRSPRWRATGARSATSSSALPIWLEQAPIAADGAELRGDRGRRWREADPELAPRRAVAVRARRR